MLIPFTLLFLFALGLPVRAVQFVNWNAGTLSPYFGQTEGIPDLAQRPRARRFDVFSTDDLNTAYSRRPSPSRTGTPEKGCQDCEVKARLDNFAVQLQNEPTTQGYLKSTTSRREGTLTDAQEKAIQAEATKMKDYLIARGIDAARLVLVVGFESKQHEVELWVVPAGAVPPVP